VSYEIKDDEISGECSINGRLEIHTMFQTENLKVRDHLGVDGRIILKLILKR
jgi:hypothetical protein